MALSLQTLQNVQQVQDGCTLDQLTKRYKCDGDPLMIEHTYALKRFVLHYRFRELLVTFVHNSMARHSLRGSHAADVT